MASRYTTIVNKLKSKLDGLSKIAKVIDNPELEFDAYPAATITPIEGESDFETNVEDERTYSFNIDIYYETKNNGLSYALDALYDAADDVMNSFAGDKTLSGISLSSGTVTVVSPVAANFIDIVDKDLIAVRIKLNVKLSIDYS